MTQEQKARLTAATAELEAARLARDEYEAQIRRELDPSTPAVRIGDGSGGLSMPDVPAAGRGLGASARVALERMYPVSARTMDGWRDARELFAMVGSERHDPRLMAAGQGGETDPYGGFAIPSALSFQIMAGTVPESIFLSRANVQPMTARVQEVATFDRSTDGANGTMFGFKLEFIGEGGDGASVQTATLRQVRMTAHTAAILFDSSNELLQDAAGGFENGLMDAVRRATAYGIDRHVLRGTGVGSPLGIVNQPALITIDAEEGQGSDSIVVQNIDKMYARCPAYCVRDAIWLASPTCIPQLLGLTRVVGVGGAPVPAMREESGRFYLHGLEVIFTDLCSPVGDIGDILLVAPREYTIGMRAGLALDKSAHVGFCENRMTFRLLLRFDGTSGWDRAFEPELSAPTQSPFIALAKR